MSFIEQPPLREQIAVSHPLGTTLLRPWQRWFQKIADRFRVLVPSLNATPDIVWDDLRTPASAAAIGPTVPTLGVVYGGLRTRLFAGTGPTNDELFFDAQLPHKYKPGTEIRPHVHWMKTTAGAGGVRWGLEYDWVNVGDTSPATTTTIQATEPDGPAQWEHTVTSLGSITGTGKKESSVLLCRVFRDQTHADDTYGADAAVLSLDIHHQVHKLGTGPEFPT